MKRFFQSWLTNTLAVLVAVYLVPGIHYRTGLDLLGASLLLGILNAVIRHILMFMSLPLLIFSLGLFILVINALLLDFVGYLLRPAFSVQDFSAAFWGALVISLVSLILNTLTSTARSRIHLERRRPPPGGGNGPVIDI